LVDFYQGDLALMIDYDSRTGVVEIVGYAKASKVNNNEFTECGVMNAYMEQAVQYSALPDSDKKDVLKYMETREKPKEKAQFLQEYIPCADLESYQQEVVDESLDENEGDFAQYVGKKYKPVALKVKLIYGDLPEKFRIK
jgi:hypothetical protein